MNRRSFHFVAALLGLCWLSGPTLAEEAVEEPGLFGFSGEYLAEETYVGSGDVHRRNGQSVNNFDENDSILRFVFTPRVSFGILRLGLEWERFGFSVSNTDHIPDTLQSVGLVIGLDTQISDSILLRVEAQPGAYNTGVESMSDDFNMPFVAGGTYIYNPNLQFIAGVSVDIERKHPVLPAAGVRWKVSRQWVIDAVLPKPQIEFEWNKDVTLSVGANIIETNFRVDDSFGDARGNPRLDHAVLSYSEVRTGAGLDWKISPVLTLTTEAGYQPYRSFDFYRAHIRFNEDGGAPYGMISLHGAF
jgi:hypothetical protein